MDNAPYLTKKIHPITISLIGVGGNGSQLLTQLARINKALIGLDFPGIFVSVFDTDVVTEANIGRQLFSSSDIGFKKGEVLVNRVNKFFGTDWYYVDEMITKTVEPTDVFWSNIVITCTDNVQSRLDVFHWLKHQTVFVDNYLDVYYWLDLGNSKDVGQIVMGTVQLHGKMNKFEKRLPNLFDMFPNYKDTPDDNTPSCSLAEALEKQDLFVNTFVTNIAAKLLWDVLRLSEIEWHGAFYNGTNLNIKKLKC